MPLTLNVQSRTKLEWRCTFAGRDASETRGRKKEESRLECPHEWFGAWSSPECNGWRCIFSGGGCRLARPSRVGGTGKRYSVSHSTAIAFRMRNPELFTQASVPQTARLLAEPANSLSFRFFCVQLRLARAFRAPDGMRRRPDPARGAETPKVSSPNAPSARRPVIFAVFHRVCLCPRQSCL